MQLGLSIDPEYTRGSSKIKAALTCPICSLLLQSPVIRCEQCGNYFCQFCLTTWWAKHNEPNTCIYKCTNAQLKVIKREGMFQPMLELLEFVCQNEGCEEISNLQTVKKHMKECQFLPTNCQYCNKTCMKKSLLQHYDTCQQFPTFCQHCKISFKRLQLQNHEEECQMKLFKCQNEKCEEMKTKVQLQQHKLECLYEINQCKWCQSKLIKKQMITHNEVCELKKILCQGCVREIAYLDITNHKQQCKDIKEACAVCSNLFSRKQILQKHTVNYCMINQIKQLRRENVSLRQSNVGLKLMLENLSGKYQQLELRHRREDQKKRQEEQKLKRQQPKNTQILVLEKDFQRLDYSIGSLEKLKAGEFSEHMKKPHIFGDWCPICKQIDKKFAKMIQPLETQRNDVMEKLRLLKKGKQK